MTKKVQQTLQDLKGIDFLLTRFNPETKTPDDLDILVNPHNFEKCIETLISRNYRASSHDHALGGRIAGMQANLVKPGRIKIDLHQDFTWRQKQYVDIKKIWENSKLNRVDLTWDAFLIMINVILKRPILYKKILKCFSQWEKLRTLQSMYNRRFNMVGTIRLLISKVGWKVNNKIQILLFLPVRLVLSSYLENLIL